MDGCTHASMDKGGFTADIRVSCSRPAQTSSSGTAAPDSRSCSRLQWGAGRPGAAHVRLWAGV